MTAPKRIQLSRAKGWRKPAGAVVVARPTRWGNPIDWRKEPKYPPPHRPDGELDDDPRRIPDATRRLWAVTDFRMSLLHNIGGWWDQYPSVADIRAELAGRDLACWCPLDQPCHADVLLEVANGDGPT